MYKTLWEDFSSLANEYTNDPGNAGDKGGDLGWFKKGRMVKPFEEAAFRASKNEIIGPILSKFGYHIIYIRDKRTDKDGNDEILASHSNLFKVKFISSPLKYLPENKEFKDKIKIRIVLLEKY